MGSQHAVIAVTVDAWRMDEQGESFEELEGRETVGLVELNPGQWILAEHTVDKRIPWLEVARRKYALGDALCTSSAMHNASGARLVHGETIRRSLLISLS